MLRLINRFNINAYPVLVRSMHQDRKRLFIDIFGWDLAHENGEERDGFDDDIAEYLVLADAAGDHIASLRFLRTDRPHLLDTLFPRLCETEIPRGAHIREVTRLCLPLRKRARIEARNILARGILDYAKDAGVSSFTAVCHMAFLSEVLAAGWRCAPLGAPMEIGGALAGAVQIHADGDANDLLARPWRCAPSAPRIFHLPSTVDA